MNQQVIIRYGKRSKISLMFWKSINVLKSIWILIMAFSGISCLQHNVVPMEHHTWASFTGRNHIAQGMNSWQGKGEMNENFRNPKIDHLNSFIHIQSKAFSLSVYLLLCVFLCLWKNSYLGRHKFSNEFDAMFFHVFPNFVCHVLIKAS